jgi:hypothetical protein
MLNNKNKNEKFSKKNLAENDKLRSIGTTSKVIERSDKIPPPTSQSLFNKGFQL